MVLVPQEQLWLISEYETQCVSVLPEETQQIVGRFCKLNIQVANLNNIDLIDLWFKVWFDLPEQVHLNPHLKSDSCYLLTSECYLVTANSREWIVVDPDQLDSSIPLLSRSRQELMDALIKSIETHFSYDAASISLKSTLSHSDSPFVLTLEALGQSIQIPYSADNQSLATQMQHNYYKSVEDTSSIFDTQPLLLCDWTLFLIKNEIDVLVDETIHFLKTDWSDQNIHVYANQLVDGHLLLRSYYRSNHFFPKTTSKLLDSDLTQVACIFGGQGPNKEYLIELQYLFDTYQPLVQDFIRSTTSNLDIPVMEWLETGVHPDISVSASVPVSSLLICITQICQYLVTSKVLGLTPGQLRDKFIGTSGHSQGIASACIISSADTEDDLVQYTKNTIKLIAFYSKVCFDSWNPETPKEDMIADCKGKEGYPSAMLSVLGLSQQKLQELINEVNVELDTDTVAISLANGTGNNVVTGPPTSLYAVVTSLRSIKNQSNRLKFFFLPVSVPFHSDYLVASADTVLNSLNGRELFRSTDLKIPVYDTYTGQNLQREPDVTTAILLSIICQKLDWDLSLQNFTNATHIVDFGAGGNNGVGKITPWILGKDVIVLLMDKLHLILNAISIPDRNSWQTVPKFHQITSSSNWNATEEVIRDEFSKLFAIRSNLISRSHSLIALGLDSIAATYLSGELVQHSIYIDPSAILANPTISEMAKNAIFTAEDITPKMKNLIANFDMIQSEVRGAFSDNVVDTIESIFPASPLQCAMLSASINSNDPVYINHSILEVEETVDLNKLIDAFKVVISANEILRTGFLPYQSIDYPFLQVVFKTFPGHISHETVPITSMDQFEKIKNDIVNHSPFIDYSHPPLTLKSFTCDKKKFIMLSLHHAIFDGWSITLLLRDVISVYKGESLVERVGFKPFILSMYSSDHEEAEKHWKMVFSDCEIPSLMKVNDKGTDSKIVSTTHTIPVDMNHFKDICAKYNVTAQTLIMASWALTLSKLYGSDDVSFGHVLSGRTVSTKGALDTLAPLLNTLPFRCKVDKSNTQEFLNTIQQTNVYNLQNPHTSIRNIQKWSGKPQLFDSLFIFQQESYERSQTQNELFTEVDTTFQLEYPLGLKVLTTDISSVIDLKASYEYFSQASLSRISLMIEADLLSLLNQPTLTDPKEFYSIVPQCTFVPENCLQINDYVHNQAMKDPQSIAVSYIDDLQTATVQHYTYEYLDVVSNQIANLLLGKGIQLEDIVVICMEKSVMSYASMLGVLKAGGAYCCVDIKLPSSRKEFIIQDSDCKFVLTSNGEVQSLQSIVSLPVNQTIEVLNVDTVSYEELSSVYPNRNIQGHNLAYVIYTSGTTGQPKGVLVEHANVQHAMDGFSQMIPLTNTDHFLQFASLSFDVSVFEIFYTFMKGASLVTADQEVLLSDIVKCINILQVTHMDLTPTVASLITSREQVPTVRVLVSGGEGMTQQHTLFNAYGPTEATIGCTMYCNVLADVRPSQIGKGFPSCSLYVISLGGELLPKGCIGELCVGGPQVTRGYLNRDEVTSKSFVTG
ncbi:hypothetical protein HDV02_003937, partial [Globomyces sp. JEL0801]